MLPNVGLLRMIAWSVYHGGNKRTQRPLRWSGVGGGPTPDDHLEIFQPRGYLRRCVRAPRNAIYFPRVGRVCVPGTLARLRLKPTGCAERKAVSFGGC